MILISHPTGNQNLRNAASALAEDNLLDEFWTSIAWDEHGFLARCLPARAQDALRRRSFPDPLRPYIHLHPWRETGRMLANRLGWSALTKDRRRFFGIDAVYESLDRRVARRLYRRKPAAIYAYEDGAAESFAAAEALGIHRFYELPIGYWRSAHIIFSEEIQRLPEWASTLLGLTDDDKKLARKDRELRLADTIFVPSTFTKETLSLAPAITARIHIQPYGGPTPSAPRKWVRRTGKLRALSVGGLSQRKGIAYTFQAIDILDESVELTVIGKKSSESCIPLNEALRKNRWIKTLPHAKILEEMSRHDVLVFPSLFEGFGLVILEAMSQGLVVITTPNSGGGT